MNSLRLSVPPLWLSNQCCSLRCLGTGEAVSVHGAGLVPQISSCLGTSELGKELAALKHAHGHTCEARVNAD